MNFGKNVKKKAEYKRKTEILAQENFQKRGNQLKRGTLTPLQLGETNGQHLCYVYGSGKVVFQILAT